MKILIKLKPSSRKEEILKIDDDHYLVSVKSPARNNQANSALINVLTRYFNIPADRIKIIGGHKSRQKTVMVNK